MLLSVTVLHHSNRLSSMTDRVSPDVEPRPPLPLLCPILAPLATQAATCTSQRKEKRRRPHGKEEGGKLLGLWPSHLGSSAG